MKVWRKYPLADAFEVSEVIAMMHGRPHDLPKWLTEMNDGNRLRLTGSGNGLVVRDVPTLFEPWDWLILDGNGLSHCNRIWFKERYKPLPPLTWLVRLFQRKPKWPPPPHTKLIEPLPHTNKTQPKL
jgi:hypothetical protein